MKPTIRSIVCGVDFSPPSMAALALSLALARHHQARLAVVHAVEVPPLPYVERGLATVDEARLTAELEGELREAVGDRVAGVPVVCRAAVGWPAAVILREAHAVRADLVVLGTRGLTGLPRFLLGSVTERVARTSPTDVLVVPAIKSPRLPRTVLCGVDFSAPSAAALRAAAALAESHGAALHLVHAFAPASYAGEALLAEHARELGRLLEREAERAGLDPHTTPCTIRRGTPCTAIVEQARAVGADWIVVGNIGHSGVRHFLLGGVAERVLRIAPVPVLVVRRRSGRSTARWSPTRDMLPSSSPTSERPARSALAHGDAGRQLLLPVGDNYISPSGW